MKNVQEKSKVTGWPEKEIFSTGELATRCFVTKHTIISAIERGELQASRTPGGHNRIRREDAIDFMRRYKLLPATLTQSILVVDAEEFVREIVEQVFGEAEGCAVFHATNGYQAGKLVERLKPDLILLDLQLRDINARELCGHIHEEEFAKPCRVLAVTTARGRRGIKALQAAEVDDYITKPFSIDELREKVSALLAPALIES